MTKAYSNLTRRAKAARLFQAGQNALQHYDISIAKFAPIRFGFNALYRVWDTRGHQYALRVHPPTTRPLSTTQIETAWLQALHVETDLSIVKPVLNTHDEFVTPITIEGHAEKRHAVLFHWIEGYRPRTVLHEKYALQLGKMMAHLHNHAATFTLPPDLTPPKLDTFWWNGKPEAIYANKTNEFFTTRQQQLFQKVARKLEQILQEMYADTTRLHLLHCDLHQAIIKIECGNITALDFDDCQLGYGVQDMGITLNHLQQFENYEILREAFFIGYLRYRELSDQEMDLIPACIIMRDMLVVGYCLASERVDLKQYLMEILPQIEGRLREFIQQPPKSNSIGF